MAASSSSFIPTPLAHSDTLEEGHPRGASLHDLVELVRQSIMETRRFTITELSSQFPQISRSLLHEIVPKHLLFKQLCARRVPKKPNTRTQNSTLRSSTDISATLSR
ncbi:hypothetical protein TNCV_4580911 [Trichonephila clavipes]|nr:hypothetical protein TNCV_4580911 [Trichonephila clavipes]